MKTCWHSLPHFREVGKALMRKYWKARGVAAASVAGGNQKTAGKRSSKRLRLRLRSARSSSTATLSAVAAAAEEPKITELVYLEQSPNYCDRDFGAGSLGTYGRSCNRTSEGELLKNCVYLIIVLPCGPPSSKKWTSFTNAFHNTYYPNYSATIINMQFHTIDIIYSLRKTDTAVAKFK